MTARKTHCPGCDTDVPLRRTDGKVRAHDLLLPGGQQRCPGSGEKPKAGA